MGSTPTSSTTLRDGILTSLRILCYDVIIQVEYGRQPRLGCGDMVSRVATTRSVCEALTIALLIQIGKPKLESDLKPMYMGVSYVHRGGCKGDFRTCWDGTSQQPAVQAQMEERLFEAQEVPGSTPGSGTAIVGRQLDIALQGML